MINMNINTELLIKLDWLRHHNEWHFESLDGECEYFLEAVLDEDDEMIDIVYTHGSYRTSLMTEPDFWVWEALEVGDWVAEY